MYVPLTYTQYRILLDLYHEFNEAFVALPDDIKQAFYNRLYKKD